MRTLTASTNRATHLTANTCELHMAGRTAEERRTTPTFQRRSAQPQPDPAQILEPSAWVAAATHRRLGQSNRLVREKGRYAAEIEHRKVRTLLIEEAHRRHEVERSRNIAESLRDVMAILNAERPLGDVFEYIASQANRLFSSQAAAVYRSGHETEAVLTQAQQGSARSTVTDNLIVIDCDALKQTIQQHGAFAIANVPRALADVAEQMPAAASPAFIIPIATGCSTLLAVPIVIRGEVYGGLVLYDVAPRLFAHDQVELANAFADQAALAIDNAMLRQQAAEAAAAQERNRLARDLHDAVTQVIFSANLMAEALPRVWERDPDEGQRGLEQLRLLTRGALAEMRTLLFDLRPAALQDKPLPELLRQLTEAMGTRSQASITFEAQGTCMLPASVHVAIYRIAQEALNNATKHAAARTIRVVLHCSLRRLLLRIHDDGCGFATNDVTGDHFGMAIMQERARPIGARCSVTSHPGEGTQVTVVWPAATAAGHDRPQSAIGDAVIARRLAQVHESQAQPAYAHV
jgi:signal transduction histidine kinase